MNDSFLVKELRFFARHCLFLHCQESIVTQAQSVPLLTSGFVLCVEDEWFFVTAGHCLQEISHKKSCGVVYSDWALVDAFALSRPRPHEIDAPEPPNTIPFRFEQAYSEFLFDQDKGIDCGFIHLEQPAYRSLLQANGIEPLEGMSCRMPPSVVRECDRMEMFGIPQDQLKDLGGGRFYGNLVGITLGAVEDSDPAWVQHPKLFHASLPDITRFGPAGLSSLKGMSGGPIIGSKQVDGEERYGVVAIQSSWDKRSRIQACYVFPLTRYLEKLVARMRRYKEGREQDLSASAP